RIEDCVKSKIPDRARFLKQQELQPEEQAEISPGTVLARLRPQRSVESQSNLIWLGAAVTSKPTNF
ncbi:MAG: hypothetical protein ACREBC_25595, partial [Pyrinomonadaceae bacterium]